MRKSMFTEQKSIGAVTQIEAGVPVEELLVQDHRWLAAGLLGAAAFHPVGSGRNGYRIPVMVRRPARAHP